MHGTTAALWQAAQCDEDRQAQWEGDEPDDYRPCPTCEGVGWTLMDDGLWRRPCGDCRGYGYIRDGFLDATVDQCAERPDLPIDDPDEFDDTPW